MILNIGQIRGYSLEVPKTLTWDEQLREMLLKKSQTHSQKTYNQKHEGTNLRNLIKFIDKQPDQNIKVQLPQSPHSFYSSFIPLKHDHYRYLNEYEREFPVLHFFKLNAYHATLQKIGEMLVKNFKQGQQGRDKIKAYLNPHISFSVRLSRWVQLLKFGTKSLEGLVHPLAQIYYLWRVGNRLNNQSKLKTNSQLSIESGTLPTLQVISRTMKHLYCPLCLKYDCGVHDSPSFGSTHSLYVSAGCKISKQSNLEKAVRLLSMDQDEETKPLTFCTRHCFRQFLINPQTRQRLQLCPFMSEMAKSVIEMGLSLFSWDPCKIATLFLPNQITCNSIAQYLLDQLALVHRLELKFQQSQVSMLMNEQLEESMVVPEKQKARRRKKNKQKQRKIAKRNSICFHHFVGSHSIDSSCEQCVCQQRGYCLPECLCTDKCSIMRIGCRCKKNSSACRTNKCNCFKNDMQCHPKICKGCCGGGEQFCANTNIQEKANVLMRIGVSRIEGGGLGVFAGQYIKKDRFVAVYLGEELDPYAEHLRQITRRNNCFYNFNTPSMPLDARYFGNKTRFINHGGQGVQNLVAHDYQDYAGHKIYFTALRNIQEGEQLFFNYDGSGNLKKHHSEQYPFILSQ